MSQAAKAPGTALRQFVVSEMVAMLRHFGLMYGQPAYAGIFDPEVMRQLETHEDRFDLAVVLANHMLEEVGYDIGEPADPRFDKTRRAAAKKKPKPPKGLSAKERAEWEASHGEGAAP